PWASATACACLRRPQARSSSTFARTFRTLLQYLDMPDQFERAHFVDSPKRRAGSYHAVSGGQTGSRFGRPCSTLSEAIRAARRRGHRRMSNGQIAASPAPAPVSGPANVPPSQATRSRRRLLVRFTAWGTGAVAAVTIAVLAGQATTGSR